MVAGMMMPLSDLKTIYELLFRDGVIVAKKDKCPLSLHPAIKGVTNLKVIQAVRSLKSKGYVRETFAWKHAYYYLTNDGITYLRDFLHLPPKIVPATLQRHHCAVSSAPVQTVKGPSSRFLKAKTLGRSQDARMDVYVKHQTTKGTEKEEPKASADQKSGVLKTGKDSCRRGDAYRRLQPL